MYAGRSTCNRGTRHICPLSKHIRDYSVIIKTVFIYNLFACRLVKADYVHIVFFLLLYVKTFSWELIVCVLLCSVIFVLTYFLVLVLVLVFEIFFSFSFVLVFIIFSF